MFASLKKPIVAPTCAMCATVQNWQILPIWYSAYIKYKITNNPRIPKLVPIFMLERTHSAVGSFAIVMIIHMNKANTSMPIKPQGSPRYGTVFHSGFPITLAQSQTVPALQYDPPPISCALLCIQSV